MPIQLYNNLHRRLETFEPADPERVTLYVCGPTVYNYVHIGNARPPVVFGVLARLLRRRYGNLRYARNITDVDDKINAAAIEQGVPISVITERFSRAYAEDMAALGVEPPDLVPHATAHIGEILRMCERLIQSGHAYVAEQHVLFAVDSFPDYGKLSRRSTDEMLAGARVEVAPYKRSPGDFVLWKPSTPELPGWDSPWGRGRPGWHIECSAMCEAHLGDTIDIHAGGVDLQFPHHENEIAQSTCAHGGKVFARFWLHNGMLNMDGRKMSKSLGNVFRVHDLIDKYPPEALRYALLSAHYRQPLDWSEQLIEQSIRTLDRLYGTLRELDDISVSQSERTVPAAFEAALNDDLNTPQALAALAQIAGSARQAQSAVERHAGKAALLGAGELIGLLQQDPEVWFCRGLANASVDAEAIEKLLEERRLAKLRRDFGRADMLRQQLKDQGVEIEDGANGTRWKLAGAGNVNQH
ncbi:MAG: cysteine--tRNA ligase [Lysobacterales bacterium CG02_land_8_20_14_3_00_62_12]|nr:MAG: cysteine--tRNA ligase [Xanthomonadales bacterium CG02_land_8_20_14_3_00_62_12]